MYGGITESLKKHNIYVIKNINDIDYSEWKHIVYLDAAADFSYGDNNIIPALGEKYNLESSSEVYEIFKIYEYSLK
jgi:hypothetical protein